MSVLIKGVDMPKNCTWCPCATVDGATKDPMNNEIFNMFCAVKKDYWTCYRALSGKPTWCPLVEVKPPHGRLIDVDASCTEMKNRQKECAKWRDETDDPDIKIRADGVLSAFIECRLALNNMPTVIEAETEE